MLPIEPDTRDGDSLMLCKECSVALAHDQRYCIECGARRGGLPRSITEVIGAILEQGRRVKRTDRQEVEAAFSGSPKIDSWMPTPRAAAVAVLGMLAFGVVVGSLVGGGAPTSLSAPLLVAVSPSSTQAGSTAGGAAAGSGSSTGAAGAASAASAASPAAAATQSSSAIQSSPLSGLGGGGGSSSSGGAPGLPPIKHVFLIVLSDHGFNDAFGPRARAPYLAKTLRAQGKLVENYYSVTPGPLANEIALISGQGPTPQTAANCATYADIKPATKGSGGQVLGAGCVYPSRTKTLPDQLSAAHRGWRAYIQNTRTGKTHKPATCQHPKLGAVDTQTADPTDSYVTWRNPFVYFHSVIDGTGCDRNEVGLDQLRKDLKTASKTPAFSYIVPDRCGDGSTQPCAPRAPLGLAASDGFLKSVVPAIEQSAAYKADGMIAITFDQAPQDGVHPDPSSCCSNPTFPNLPSSTTTPTTTTPTTTPTATTPATTTPTTTTPASTGTGSTSPTGGGGQVGLLLISPYIKPGSIDVLDYFNHFSLLASIENLFGLGNLGYAGDSALPVFDASLFTAHQ